MLTPLAQPMTVFAVRECLFACRTKIDEINQRKEEELKAMSTRIQKLQSDLSTANQVCVYVRAPIRYTFRYTNVI